MSRFPARWALPILFLLLLLSPGIFAAESRKEPLPAELKDVGVTEHLNAAIPLDLLFDDERGQPVHLRDYFNSGKPVVIQLGYYACPMLCTLVSQGIVDSLKKLDLTMGQDFQMVMVSFDPAEKPTLAYMKKQTSIKEYGRPVDAAGWHFLTGREKEIRALADAVGFHYTWVDSARQWAHPAVIVILTPDGRVSRYLYGVKFDPQTFRLSLVEASAGKIGTTTDQLLLYCFHYDPASGRYTVAALRLMQLGGILTVLVLSIVLWRLFRREARLARQKAAPSQQPSPPNTPVAH